MHSLSMPESFISVKCCRNIGNQNCHSLGYGVEPSTCFQEKVHQVKVNYGSNQLANWGKRRIQLHHFLVYCQHMIVPIYQKKKLEDFETPYFKSGIQPIPGAQTSLQKLSTFCSLSVVTYDVGIE